MTNVSRRTFLQATGMTLTGALLAACAAAAPQGAAETGAAGESAAEAGSGGHLQIYVQAYTPTENMEKSPNNPIPHNMIEVLANEYMEDNPGVEVEIIRKPPNVADHEWIVTQQAGSTIPHIVWSHSFWIQDELDKGWWVALDPYFDQPNPYVEAGQPGSERWLDQFYETPTEAKRLQDGKLYVVPIDLVTTFFFYNKDIFTEAGVEPPTTYGEWIAAQQKLQEFGVIPNGRIGWYNSQIGAMLYAKKDAEINKDGGVATLEEVACAIQNGLYRATDRIRRVDAHDAGTHQCLGSRLGGRRGRLCSQVPQQRDCRARRWQLALWSVARRPARHLSGAASMPPRLPKRIRPLLLANQPRPSVAPPRPNGQSPHAPKPMG
ncbi:MAG: extracellular solute-binding protein [Caldilineaceae bacterium]